MQENEKCLSPEAIDLLLWSAKNGAFLLADLINNAELVDDLVVSGHLFQGQPVAENDATSIHYSITKKGFSVMQCNFLWNIYGEENAPPHVVIHANQVHHDCDQSCLRHEVKASDSGPATV